MKECLLTPLGSLKSLREAGSFANRALENGFYTIRNVDASREVDTDRK